MSTQRLPNTTTSTHKMSTQHGAILRNFLRPKNIIHLFIRTTATLGLATFLLWCLVSNSEPKATINNLSLTPDVKNNWRITFEIQFNNENYFRGFNITYGYIAFVYVADEPHGSIPNFKSTYIISNQTYLGFRKSIPWNYTWTTESSLRFNTSALRTHESYIYVPLSLGYYYRILFWNTDTTNHQFLDCKVYLNNDLSLMEPVNFETIKDFTIVYGV